MPPQTTRSSTTASQTAQPQPRQSLRNRHLPKLPDFEFPKREPSPDPVRSHPITSSRVEGPKREAPVASESREAETRRFLQATVASQSEAGDDEDNSELLDRNEKFQRRIDSFEKQTGSNEAHSQLKEKVATETEDTMAISDMSKKSQWIFYAITSGGCAAANGVFAKLTTTDLTTSIATSIANSIGLSKGEAAFEVVVRAVFFGLNLIFNGIMWALFTKALSRSPSTTQVSILNTSSNFMLTALLGFIIFSESLPPLWWLGAAMLVAGNVIIGRREEKDVLVVGEGDAPARAAEGGHGTYRDSREEGTALLVDDIELESDSEEEIKRKRQLKKQEQDDILDFERPSGAAEWSARI